MGRLCGWKSAHLGKTNFKGPRTVFDGSHGLFNTFAHSSIVPNFSKLINKLGSYWHTNDVAMKPLRGYYDPTFYRLCYQSKREDK